MLRSRGWNRCERVSTACVDMLAVSANVGVAFERDADCSSPWSATIPTGEGSVPDLPRSRSTTCHLHDQMYKSCTDSPTHL